MARAIRFRNANEDNMPALKDVPEERKQNKLDMLHQGGELLEEHPRFPQSKRCNDVVWGLLFTVVAGLVVAGAVWGAMQLKELHHATKPAEPVVGDVDASQFTMHANTLYSIISGAVLGGGVGLITSYLFVLWAQYHANCVVHTALLLGPAFMIVAGVGMFMFGLAGGPFGVLLMIGGGVFVAFGLCLAFTILCWWGKLIPFTIRVTEIVATVASEHPCLGVVALIGSMLGSGWVLACIIFFGGWSAANPDALPEKGQQADGSVYGIYFVFFFVLIWGLQVAQQVCHVTYCGVYGRWYFDKDRSNQLAPSLRAALTTSFGSVCKGSFLVAIIQALEQLARMLMRAAANDSNWVLCILALVLTCVLDCIGDILEYFTEWAYVQCAIRNVSFCQAAKMTYTLCTCANAQYVWDDLIINNVVLLGSIVCGLAGAGAGAIVGFVFDSVVGAGAGALAGLLSGLVSGSTCMSIISSGTKTVLTCWAEEGQDFQGDELSSGWSSDEPHEGKHALTSAFDESVKAKLLANQHN